jgi:hypothetical protein
MQCIRQALTTSKQTVQIIWPKTLQAGNTVCTESQHFHITNLEYQYYPLTLSKRPSSFLSGTNALCCTVGSMVPVSADTSALLEVTTSALSRVMYLCAGRLAI